MKLNVEFQIQFITSKDRDFYKNVTNDLQTSQIELIYKRH
jgi:hypothetical protein